MSDRYPGGIITKTPVTPAGPYAEGSATGVWTLEQQAYWQAQGLWPNANNPTPNDPYFQYVTSLLHGDGTNGGQNNTFLDSSTNAFTITRNGNTTQGSFSPYGPNWGTYLDGSSYVYTSSSSNAFNFGTGDFTVEFWLNPLVTSRTFTVAAATYYTGFYIQRDIPNTLDFNFNNSALALSSSNFDATKGMWTHYAIVRSGGTASLFQNGVRVATTSNTSNISISDNIIIGAADTSGSYPSKSCYISNFRVVNGTAVYDPTATSITVPTSPLTAVTNTSLLVFGSNRFVDTSINNAALTIGGTPKVTRFSPFAPTISTQYSQSVDGGSGFFDGTGDYLETASSSSVSVFAGDFTIEGWFYITGSATWNDIVGNSNNDWYVEVNSSQYIDTSFGITSSSGSAPKNAWNHFAVVRSGSTIALMLNGTRVGTTTNSSTIGTTSAVRIGSNGEPATGYISNIRIVNGTAVYSPSGSTYTVPTSPLTAVSNTQLLCNMTNAAIYDNSMVTDAETAGNAQISTSVKKYGTGSLSFDGTSDYLTLNNTGTEYAFGTGNFTIECWIYLNTFTSGRYIYDGRSTATTNVAPSIYMNGTATLIYQTAATTRITGPTLSSGIWYHVAVCRSGGFTKMFVNGTQFGSTYADSNNYLGYATAPTIGSIYSKTSTLSWDGYIDDVRITNGYARYWENFTPPTAAFPNFGGAPQIPAQDPQFDYTTMLLPGNGTNGAQNNTFLDSSTNNFTITRNGNTTQGTFTPFSQTGWSNFFNGSSSITVPDNTAFDYGSGDFTLECWIHPTATNNNVLLTSHTSGVDYGPCNLFFSSGALQLYSSSNNSSFDVANGASVGTPPVGQWSHVAVSRSGTSIRCFLNGTLTSRTTSSATLMNATGTFQIASRNGGEFYSGYVSNFRVNKGTALYTSNFTPSTTPLTAVSGTSLLTCQSNRFIDNSTNAFAITANGSPQVQAFSPFAPTAAYSASTVGGSGYFDGTGDYLDTTLTGQAIGTGNFTIEGWVYPTTLTGDKGVFQIGPSTSPNNDGVGIFISNSTGLVGMAYDGTYTIGSIAAKINAWNHIAVVRSSSTITVYVNGASAASVSSSTNYTGTSMLIGAYYNSTYGLNGYLSSVRYVKGTAVYTTTFTPPTTPLTAISGTQLLTNFTNAGITDATAKNNLETVGNAQISTTQSKFGGSSIAFDGSGDYLVAPNSILYSFGNADFTIETWVYLNSTSNQEIIVKANNSSTYPEFELRIESSKFKFYSSSSSSAYNTQFAGATTVTTGQWYHVAVTRYGSLYTIWLNGASDGTATSSSTIYSNTDPVSIGAYGSGGTVLNGYIQDLRLTKGYARYVQPFTPPAQADQLY